MRSLLRYATAALALRPALSVSLDVNSKTSIQGAAKQIAQRMLENFYYGGNPPAYYSGIPGLLPQAPVKYYWWETGSMLMMLVDYWYLTGDTTFNNLTSDGILFQVGPEANFMPPNQTSSLGNDDQAFFALCSAAAFEYNYPNPPSDQPQWLALTQAVFNTQVARWDTSTCNGGLRWQIFSFNAGWDYKNSPSNSALFNIAARLSAFTGNASYAQYAEKVWDWEERIGLYGSQGEVFDGTDDLINCTEINHVEWTYSSGMMIHGAAVMYSITNDSKWLDRVNLLWKNGKAKFFNDAKIMTESACEGNNPVNCNTDQLSFKSTYAHFLALTTKYIPSFYDEVIPYLQASAAAAAAQCTGGDGGDLCGTQWTLGKWDGTSGVGQSMSAMAVVMANLIKDAHAPYTNKTGGTSVGNPEAGIGSSSSPLITYGPLTTGDKAGAGILTAMVLAGTLSLGWFVCH